MSYVTDLTRLVCGKRYAPEAVDYVCPGHGDDGVLSVNYDYYAVGRRVSREPLARVNDPTMWRYRALLPVEDAAKPPPLIESRPSVQSFGHKYV